MVRGECEAAVAVAARADRINLAKMPAARWLNTRGHFRLPARAQEAIPVMQRAFKILASGGVGHNSIFISPSMAIALQF